MGDGENTQHGRYANHTPRERAGVTVVRLHRSFDGSRENRLQDRDLYSHFRERTITTPTPAVTTNTAEKIQKPHGWLLPGRK